MYIVNTHLDHECLQNLHLTIQRIDHNENQFWWGQHQNERKIHWRRWELICAPKSIGGIGFQD